MKRIALLLSVLMIYQVFFHSWFLHVACQVHRWKVKQTIAEEPASLELRLAKDARKRPGAFQQWKPGEEIEFGNVYYDVADVWEDGDELVLSCVEDNFETLLLSALSGFIDMEDEKPGPNGGDQIPGLSPFLLTHSDFSFERSSTGIARGIEADLQHEMCIRKDSPPPDFS